LGAITIAAGQHSCLPAPPRLTQSVARELYGMEARDVMDDAEMPAIDGALSARSPI